ncbi:MAG: hypothetical protein ABSH08_22205 [Tepidisphaeraceae bacterium]|jgi:hypothetical protein
MGLIKDEPVGPTDPEEVKKTMEIQEKRRKIALRRERGKLENEDQTAELGW